MTKLLLGAIFAGLFLTASPANAQARDYRWGVDANHHSPHYHARIRQIHHHHHHHNRGLNTTEKVIIGAIIGGVIVDSIHRNRVEREIIVQPTCYDIQKRDIYGNVYYERVCN